jgi:hypothetical protein
VGGAIIDMSGVSASWSDTGINIDSNRKYVKAEGFKVKGNINHSDANSNGPVVIDGSYNKLIRVAAYNAGGTGNVAVVNVGGDHNLVEECWAWGTGRYKFIVYHATNTIVRRCVARHDYHGGNDGWAHQEAGFTNYDSTNSIFQNDIVIDSGVAGNANEVIYGCFWDENNDSSKSKSGKIEGSICLNVRTNYAGMLDKVSGTRSISNSVVWDSGGGYTAIAGGATSSYPPQVSLSNMTIGTLISSYDDIYESMGVGAGVPAAISGGTFAITNSIIYNATAYGINGSTMNSTYNALYGNGTNYGHSASGGTGDTTNVAPLTGGLRYLPRIETGSALKTAGSSGGQKGATILYKHGTDGTLYGETGYDTLTSTALWPFPNEARIKADMASYSGNGPSGARGFATGTSKDGSAQTLTKYIWEYLGNQIPSDIYGGSGDTSAPTTTITTANPSSITSDSLTIAGAASDDTAVTGCKWRMSSAPDASNGTACTGTTSFSCATSGYSSGSNTIYVGCYDAAGNYGSSAITVNYTTSDTTAPTVTISTANPSAITSNMLSISGTSSDAVGVTSCKYRIGSAPDASNGTALTGTTSWSGTATGFSSGSNTLYCGCGDAAGNWRSSSITVNYSLSGNTYYVRPDGHDTATGVNNSSNSSTGAWLTLQHAADTVAAGDTVLVADGTYAGFYVETSGISGSPITFRAIGTGANITSRNTRTADNINVESWTATPASYITIDGFNVSAATRVGIRAIAGTGIILQNNIIHNNADCGILTAGTPSIQVLYNTAYSNGTTGQMHNIYVSNAGSDSPVIRGNIAYSAGGGNGIQLNGDYTSGGDGYIDNAIIEDNIVYSNHQKGFSLISIRNGIIRNNITYNNGSSAGGIHLVQQGGTYYSTGNIVVNNTLDEPNIACVRINANNTANIVFNNICIGSTGIVFEGSGNFQSNNLSSTNGSGIFLNYAGHDYHLVAGSPAIDAGLSAYQSAAAPSVDFIGTARPQGASFDNGAYEFILNSGNATPQNLSIKSIVK